MNEFNSLSKNQKYACIASGLLGLSVFMPWADVGIMTASLMDLPKYLQLAEAFGSNKSIGLGGYMAIYSGYFFLISGGAAAYFNFKSNSEKAKKIYFGIIGYLILVILFSTLAGSWQKDKSAVNPDILNFISIGGVIFLASLVLGLIYTKRSILELGKEEENID